MGSDRDGLGRVLLRRRFGGLRAAPGLTYCVLVLVCLFVFYVRQAVAASGIEILVWLPAVGFPVATLVITWKGCRTLARGTQEFLFHEHGARHVERGAETAFRYADAVGVCFGFQRPGLRKLATLEICPPVGEPLLTLSVPARRGARMKARRPGVAQIEDVRDRAVSAIAGRMTRELDEGRSVTWTPKLTLTPGGVEVAGAGLVLWAEIDRGVVDLRRGRFNLFARGDRWPLVTEDVTAWNFLPGWQAFRSLHGEPRTAPAL